MTKENNAYYEIAKLKSKKMSVLKFGMIDFQDVGCVLERGLIKDIRDSSFDTIKIQSDPSTKRTLFCRNHS